MNEKKVKELLVQAGVYDCQPDDPNLKIEDIDKEYLTLIELVVRECARAVDKVYEDAEPDHGCYDWATWAEGADVLKHFGVK
jgi:hypothetical protein